MTNQFLLRTSFWTDSGMNYLVEGWGESFSCGTEETVSTPGPIWIDMSDEPTCWRLEKSSSCGIEENITNNIIGIPRLSSRLSKQLDPEWSSTQLRAERNEVTKNEDKYYIPSWKFYITCSLYILFKIVYNKHISPSLSNPNRQGHDKYLLWRFYIYPNLWTSISSSSQNSNLLNKIML